VAFVRTTIETLARLGIAAAALEDNRRLVEANDCLKGLLELGPEEGIGTDFGAVLSSKAKDNVQVGLSTVYRFSREPHSPWFRLDLKADASGFIGVLTNVGEEYEFRDEARHYNLARDRLLNDGRIGTWRYDPDAELYFFSTELSLGYEGAGSGVPVSLLQLLQHPDDKDKDTGIRERITREGGTANAEIRYREANGAWTHLNVHYRSGRRLASGRFEMFGISQNITDVATARDEASRLSERLSQALRQADYANRTKTEFLANMSHELRTPLNAILGFSEIIAGGMFGPIADKYARYAHDIHRSGEHLLALVNDVLDLAKLEAGKLELRESDIDVRALVEDCLSLLRGRVEAGMLALSHSLDPSVSRVRGDARAVKQILLNFLSNAVKFTPEGGDICVATERDEKGCFRISVRDSGIGMSEADIEVAMSAFGQVDSSLARRHEGTGLGLPICKSLMELHGGEIVVASEPNVGTTFAARFPASRVRVSEAA
jgi:signal transduction histidine kinase